MGDYLSDHANCVYLFSDDDDSIRNGAALLAAPSDNRLFLFKFK